MNKPTWKPITIRLGDVIPWQHNPRMSTKAQALRLIDSEKEFGQPQPFSVSPTENGKVELYDGHQRYSAWLTVYGEEYRVNASQCSRHLSHEERQKFVITMHAGAVGSWDWQIVSGWDAPKVTGWGMDKDLLKGWNSDSNNLKELLRSQEPETADAPAQVDRAAELLEKWQVVSGDMFAIGEHRLICGDCTDAAVVARVMGGERAGACVTDSPYGINREGIENDDPEGLRKLFDGCLAVMPIDNGVIINFQSPRLFPVWLDAVRVAGHKFERALWMYKSNDVTFPWRGWIMSSEIIILSSIGKPEWADVHPYAHDCYVYKHDEDLKGLQGIHTTVKPTSIVQDLISRIGGDVYEPFTGSGTTLVACQNLGRRGRGVEISPAYCAVTLERMATAFPELIIQRV